MLHVTRLLDQIQDGDLRAAEQLLPLVYDELRRLATVKLAEEKAGQTLQATALVHEAYVRLVKDDPDLDWNGRGHFFAAAAEAMRRILIETARRKQALKNGGGRLREELDFGMPAAEVRDLDLIALDEALVKLEKKDLRKAQLVKLRFFAGLTTAETANALGISVSTADADWSYARSWLRLEIGDESLSK